MPFPRDVRGVYDAGERAVVDPESGQTVRRAVTAWVKIGEVVFKAGTTPPTSDPAVVLKATGEDPKGDQKREKGKPASVYIDGSINYGDSPLGRPLQLRTHQEHGRNGR